MICMLERVCVAAGTRKADGKSGDTVASEHVVT